MTKCKAPGCGHEITFVMNSSTGKKYPCSPGLIRIATPAGIIVSGFPLHYQYCKDPGYFRREKEKKGGGE